MRPHGPIHPSLPRCERRMLWWWLSQFSLTMSPCHLYDVFLSFPLCLWSICFRLCLSCACVSIYVGSRHHFGTWLLGSFFQCVRSKFVLGNYYSVKPSLSQTPRCSFEGIVSFFLSYVVRRCWLARSCYVSICSKTKEAFLCKFFTFFHYFFFLLCMCVIGVSTSLSLASTSTIA